MYAIVPIFLEGEMFSSEIFHNFQNAQYLTREHFSILLAKLLLAEKVSAEFCLLVVSIFESTTKLNSLDYSAILSRFIQVILGIYGNQ